MSPHRPKVAHVSYGYRKTEVGSYAAAVVVAVYRERKMSAVILFYGWVVGGGMGVHDRRDSLPMGGVNR